MIGETAGELMLLALLALCLAAVAYSANQLRPRMQVRKRFRRYLRRRVR